CERSSHPRGLRFVLERNPQTWIGGGGSTGGGTGMGCGGSRSGGGRVGSCGGGGGVPGGRGGLGVWRRSPSSPRFRALARKTSIRSSGHKVRHWFRQRRRFAGVPARGVSGAFPGVFLGREAAATSRLSSLQIFTKRVLV